MSELPRLPDPAVIVLVGPSASGKSTWAAAHFRTVEIVCSDALRAVVGSGEHDLEATVEAFELLNLIVAGRTKRCLTTVIDTLGLDQARRRRYLQLARAAGLPAVVVVMRTPAAECRRRNAARDRPVPAAALRGQIDRLSTVVVEIQAEGWDVIVHEGQAEPDNTPGLPSATRPSPGSAPDNSAAMGLVLQISRFPWGADPAEWLVGIADAAQDAGFGGIALMDHLIQIPQVGRAWEPIPEPFVTLGLLAGRTSRLRLGTLVSPVTFRPAGVLAKTVATLDVLSGGRTFCGIGAGWWDREHAAYGVPFPAAKARLDQLEVAIQTCRALWSPGTKPYRGDRVDLPETTCYPRPISPIPIIVGGSGERRTLRIAAHSADGCNLPSDLETLGRKVATLRRHCADVGRNPDEVTITVLDIPIIGADRDQVASKVERLRGRTAASAFARRHHAGQIGEHVDRYRVLAERGVGTVFVSLPDLLGPADIHALAPLAAAVTGV